METNIYSKLIQVQHELKVGKSQINKHMGYKYRNAEDILEALKPLLLKNKLTIFMSDEVKMIAGRFYLEATVNLVDTESKETIFVKAFAREEDARKGMDLPQLTGASSSYARKYALNGLFGIDDTKDADFHNSGSEKIVEPKKVIPQNIIPVNNIVKKVEDKTQNTTSYNLSCSGCGGSVNPAEATYSKSKYGRLLCRNCQKDAK